jgi:hypothetical protein
MRPIATLSFDLDALSKAMQLTENEVHAYFTDGRRVSFVVERRISREVMRGELASTEGAPYDLVAEDGTKWEVRSLTRQGMYFCPSYMVGSGRSFEEAGFLQKLAGIDGYLIAHVDEFPNIQVWKVDSATVLSWHRAGRLGTTTKVSAVKALDLLIHGA